MKETILLVGHGSRAKGGNEEIEKFADQWRTQRPDWRIELCFIEFAEVLLPHGMDNAAENSDRVIVVPFILNAAGHAKMDIPQAMDAARERHPNVDFRLSTHLQACDPILGMLRRLLRSAMMKLDMPDPRTTGVVLLGRGSSDRQANGEVAKMARWLWEVTDHDLVDLAFTGVTYPRIEEAVQRQVRLGMTQVVIVPYYLFTGTLIERIERQVVHLQQQYPQVRFGATSYFGFEKEIFALVEQRVEEARGEANPDSGASAMPCDGCKYREVAIEHGYGGHHHDGAHHHHDHDHDHNHDHHHHHEHDHSHAHSH